MPGLNSTSSSRQSQRQRYRYSRVTSNGWVRSSVPARQNQGCQDIDMDDAGPIGVAVTRMDADANTVAGEPMDVVRRAYVMSVIGLRRLDAIGHLNR